jgi:hypothetical protein
MVEGPGVAHGLQEGALVVLTRQGVQIRQA